MSQKTLSLILSGHSDPNLNFNDLLAVLRSLGFDERIRGSHHIFTRSGVMEILNLQSRGGKAKVYQVRQVRSLIIKYKLGGDS
jgi:hypothetical protein